MSRDSKRIFSFFVQAEDVTMANDDADSEMSLPEGFEDLHALDNMEVGRLEKKPLVNVWGVVKSSQPPISTRGSDWKCTAEIIDISTQYARYGMKVNFFAPREQLPDIGEAGAVLRLEKIKVQMQYGQVSLLTNRATKFCVMSVSDLRNAYSQPKMAHALASKYQMSSKDMKYAIYLRHEIGDESLPSATEFQMQTEQAVSTKDKYSQLKDLKAGKFYDLLGEIIHTYEFNGRVTVYLSDYTSHSLFYDHKSNNGETDSSGRDGDEYGYTTAFIKSEGSNWPGPHGKQSIQLTLFDEHAQEIKKFEVGQWVLMRNVQVKLGNDGGHLEGFLRGSRDGISIGRISIVRKGKCPEEMKKRYEECLARRQDYHEKESKKELAASTGAKNKSKAKSKKLRKERQAATAKKTAEPQDRSVERLDLNQYVKCSNPDQPALPLSYCLDPTHYQLQRDLGPDLVRKFRAHVRVIDFFPDKLEDFTHYDESSDEWVWGFSLRVQDGNPSNDSNSSTDPSSQLRPWLLVNNSSAQFLLALDADDLRENSGLLTQVRELLFILWGDLEEKKMAVLERINQIESTQSTQPSQSEEGAKNETSRNTNSQRYSENERGQLKKTAGSKRKRTDSLQFDEDVENDIPPLYSDEEGPPPSKRKGQPLISRDINEQPASFAKQPTRESILAEFRRDPKAKNKAFTCCIQEYGNEDNGDDRMLAICETKILGDF